MVHIAHFIHVLPHFWHVLLEDKRAVTAMEYGLIAGIVAVSIITGLTKVGTTLQSTLNTIASKI